MYSVQCSDIAFFCFYFFGLTVFFLRFCESVVFSMSASLTREYLFFFNSFFFQRMSIMLYGAWSMELWISVCICARKRLYCIIIAHKQRRKNQLLQQQQQQLFSNHRFKRKEYVTTAKLFWGRTQKPN